MSLENFFIWMGTGFVLGVGMGMGKAFMAWLGARIKGIANA
jgi:hypothetical protein